MNLRSAFVAFQLTAGACDATTGLLLLLAPSFALRLMGVRAAPSEPVFLSFIGAFVLAIGLSYLLFSLPPRNESQLSGIRAVWLMTALVRLTVGTFVAVACLTRQLEPAWLSITAFDLSIAGFQWFARPKLSALV